MPSSKFPEIGYTKADSGRDKQGEKINDGIITMVMVVATLWSRDPNHPLND